MDFTPTEEQAAAAELAARIFGDLSTPERLTAAGTGSDAGLWKELCAAGLPVVKIPAGSRGRPALSRRPGVCDDATRTIPDSGRMLRL